MATQKEKQNTVKLSEVVGDGYGEFWRDKHRYRVVKGGRASKKSTTEALWLISNIMRYPQANALVVRKTYNTHHDSTFAMLKWAAERLGVTRYWQFKENPLECVYKPTKQRILFRGFDDEFYVPHSRHTEVRREDIEKVSELTIMAEGEGECGVYAIANLAKRQFFITGHAEYDPMTLKAEYDRDILAGMQIQIPCNYYPGDDPSQPPIVKWRSVANLLFANWLNYYVYQETPYNLDEFTAEND